MNFAISNNADIAKALNQIFTEAAASGKVEASKVNFVGNDKGLTMTVVDQAGKSHAIDLGQVKLDLPKVNGVGESAVALIKALDSLEIEKASPEDIEEAKTYLRGLLSGDPGSVNPKTASGTAQVMVDIFQLMALLVKLFQAQRSTAASSRSAAQAQAISAIERQIDASRDAAKWALIGGCVSSTIQLTMSGVTIGGMAAAAVKSKGCATINGVDFSKINMKSAKFLDDAAGAAANLGKVSRMGGLGVKVNDWAKPLLEDFKKPDFKLENAETMLTKMDGELKGLGELAAREPTKENINNLKLAQNKYNLVFAKKVELMANSKEFGPKELTAKKELAVEEWGKRFDTAQDNLKNDPRYIEANKSFQKFQVANEVIKQVAEISKNILDYQGKMVEANGQMNKIDEKKSDTLADSLNDLYKEAKEMMDNVRNLLTAMTESELEASRKIMA